MSYEAEGVLLNKFTKDKASQWLLRFPLVDLLGLFLGSEKSVFFQTNLIWRGRFLDA